MSLDNILHLHISQCDKKQAERTGILLSLVKKPVPLSASPTLLREFAQNHIFISNRGHEGLSRPWALIFPSALSSTAEGK